MESQEVKIDYATFGKKVWHEGLGEALKFLATQTPNKIDDVVIPVIDKIADEIFPLNK